MKNPGTGGQAGNRKGTLYCNRSESRSFARIFSPRSLRLCAHLGKRGICLRLAALRSLRSFVAGSFLLAALRHQFRARFFSVTVDDSPSPGGEGRGEVEHSTAIHITCAFSTKFSSSVSPRRLCLERPFLSVKSVKSAVQFFLVAAWPRCVFCAFSRLISFQLVTFPVESERRFRPMTPR
jgi:hypothetical protein